MAEDKVASSSAVAELSASSEALADAPKTDDVEMKDAEDTKPKDDAVSTQHGEKPAEDTSAQPAEPAPEALTADAPSQDPVPAATPTDKSKSRRKSGTTSSAKKLSKKASKAKLTLLEPKPGDHYFVKLKGYPAWPVIICTQDMLPEQLLGARPVSAARPDGTYREDFREGGKNAHNRTCPVMYLKTNEFGWVPNSDLRDLDTSTIMESVTDKMRKDLQQAYELASENNTLQFYKDMLIQFEQDRENREAAKAATKQGKKNKAAGLVDEDDSMLDVTENEGKSRASKKRKAEDDGMTPQRAESVKKTKIKLTTNTKPAPTSSSSKPKDSGSKPPKPKAKKAEEKKDETPKEPVLTPQERQERKEKEVLFLRHKLQRGLLTRDQEPKEDEMLVMSEYLTKLEGFSDLEVSIIRKTKINKVLKAILKLESIPREEEFKFKPRSHVMLEKWNKLLANENAGTPAPANGINGSAEPAETKSKEPTANGVKQDKKGAVENEEEPKDKDTTIESKAENAETEESAVQVEATA